MNKYYEFLQMAHIDCKEDMNKDSAFNLSLSDLIDWINDENLLDSYHLCIKEESHINACKELNLPPVNVKILLLSVDNYDREEAERITAYKISQNGETIELLKPSYAQGSEIYPFKFESNLDGGIPILIYDFSNFIDNIDRISMTNYWATVVLVDEHGESLILS